MSEEAKGEPGFTEAIRELEGVLARIEDDSLDIDKLAAELERAAQLLDVCRRKIRKAELEVAEVVQKLAGDG
jgi:exodeoxyribonuclease VII small subunit